MYTQRFFLVAVSCWYGNKEIAAASHSSGSGHKHLKDTALFFFFSSHPHLVDIPQTQHIIWDEEILDDVQPACLRLCLFLYFISTLLPVVGNMVVLCMLVCLQPQTNILKMMASSHAPDPLLTLLPRATPQSSPLTPCVFKTAGVVSTWTEPRLMHIPWHQHQYLVQYYCLC